jgi:uncharacterized protein YecE (DUF72 family)
MSNQPKGVLRIGTSGIVVPGSKETFPAAFQDKSRLSYYSSLFNTLEINSTFKKIPMLSTFEKWALDVGDEFQFTIKLWKEITHVKRLNINLDNIDVFFEAANHIGDKKGCLLIQFPASITAEYSSNIEQILQRLQQLDTENKWRKAIELRSVSWYNSDTYKLLDTYNASLVLQDMPKSKKLDVEGYTDFFYFRFHGPKGDYRGSYSNDFLDEQAEKIRNLLNSGKDVYAYFNNTMGNAFENAMSLKAAVVK